jgi:hypothetical protein
MIVWLPHPSNTDQWLLGYLDGHLVGEITGGNENVHSGEQWSFCPRHARLSGHINMHVPVPTPDNRAAAKEYLKGVGEAVSKLAVK